jgi:two-component system response regulator ChvI
MMPIGGQAVANGPSQTFKIAGSRTRPDPATEGEGGRIPRVLFVDDDRLYAETLIAELAERGFGVRHFADSSDFLAALAEADDADVILLDWHMPKMSGIDLLDSIRRHGIRLPVVILTGRNLIHYECQAFERGAVDFVDKSRGVETLVRRLVRVCQTGGADKETAGRTTALGRIVLHRHVSRAQWDGVDLDLTRGEYNIVELLVLNAGNYVTYRAIYDVLRSPGFVAGHGIEGYRANVRSAIKRARNKFRAVDPAFDMIESYMSFGYRWRG